MIIAGFDEAGYGPRLGPLVVAWTAFRVPDGEREPSLWSELRSAVRRDSDGAKVKLWIADSKVVRPRVGGLRLLELAALSFLRASSGRRIGTVGELIVALGGDPSLYSGVPWYDGLAVTKLPAHGWDGEIGAHAARLLHTATERGVQLLGAAARAVPEWDVNDGIRETDSKGKVLFQAFGPLLVALRSRFPGERILVTADKHGGRDFYGPLLGRLFPGCRFKIEEEGPLRSSYRIATASGPLAIRFEPEADGHALAVALASMICKYTRELFMDRLNAFFCARCPELKPTAGYPGDAERWLRDAGKALDGIPLERFVRAR